MPVKDFYDNGRITCFKWHFSKELFERYFYVETLKECSERIKNTYRCKDSDFVVVAMQERDEKTNRLIREVEINEQSSLPLVW